MSDDIQEARGKNVLIRFEGKKCIHSRNCVLGRPDVFVPNAPGEWIQPDAGSAEAVAALAQSCPSGAITYERLDGGEQEPAPKVNVVRVRENGPLAVTGSVEMGDARLFRATLCRCGASKNKPFCDSSHKEIGFNATGEPPTGDHTEMLAVRDGTVDIGPQLDGPLSVRGNLEIVSGTGRVVARVATARLCRCGQSNTKPFCDGSHIKAGFRST